MTWLDTAEHYDEETLIRVAETDAEIEDAHLAECDACRTAVDEYRDMLFCLGDDSPWDHRPLDETPNPQTIATLRSFVEEMHREDAEAEPLVAELLAGSREEWMPRLMADGKYRTAGVVRKLIAATPVVTQRSAADHHEVARLAVEISNSFAPEDHVMAKLRTAAWRELAYARYVEGAIDAAADAEAAARASLTETPSSMFDLARMQVLRALIESRCEQTGSALDRVSAAHHVFLDFGARKRALDTIWLQANVLAEKRAFVEALRVSDDILTEFADVLDDYTRASILANRGYYLRESGDYVEALSCFREAAFYFDAVNAEAPAARVDFNIAVLLYMSGHLNAAAERLERCVARLREVGLTGVSTLALLYLAEVRVAQEHFDDVEILCRAAMEQVKASAVAYRERALIALSLLREVAEHRTASAPLIQHVRSYMARLPNEPNLVFAPPPSPPEDCIFG
jgi:tetratricopeptide (TPR) repeat protein